MPLDRLVHWGCRIYRVARDSSSGSSNRGTRIDHPRSMQSCDQRVPSKRWHRRHHGSVNVQWKMSSRGQMPIEDDKATCDRRPSRASMPRGVCRYTESLDVDGTEQQLANKGAGLCERHSQLTIVLSNDSCRGLQHVPGVDCRPGGCNALPRRWCHLGNPDRPRDWFARS